MSKRIIKKSEVNDMKNNIEAVSVAATDIVSSLKDVKYSFIDLASETETAISTLKTLKEITSLTATEFENLVSTEFVKGFTNSFAKGIEEVLSVLTSEIQNSMEVISQSLGLNLSSLSSRSSTATYTSSRSAAAHTSTGTSSKENKKNPFVNPFSFEKKSERFLDKIASTLEKQKIDYTTVLKTIREKSPSKDLDNSRIESLENDISGFEDMLKNQKLHIAYVKTLPVTDKLHKQFLNMEKKYNLDKQKLEKLQLEQERKKLRNSILANRLAGSSIAQKIKDLNSLTTEQREMMTNKIKEKITPLTLDKHLSRLKDIYKQLK
jgi:hypothetical protein